VDEILISEQDNSEKPGDLVANATQPPDDSATSDASGLSPAVVKPKRTISVPHLVLDTHPLHVPDDSGIFMYSKDESRVFRIYSSLRALAVYDNRQNFHAYDLSIPTIPFGDADVKDWNQEWTMNTTKLGFDARLNDDFIVLSEFDWKGESGDAFRIRHMYMRSAHWLVGKHWTAFNTLNFLPQSVDTRSTSAHLGVRVPQIKYLGGNGNWSYQAPLDYYQPKFDEPESIDARARNIVPNLIGNVTYSGSWAQVRVDVLRFLAIQASTSAFSKHIYVANGRDSY
jgi:hypothetical protein